MKPVGVSYLLLLSSIGLAGIAQAQDCSVPVGGPNMHLNNNDIQTTTFPHGSKTSFDCDVGHVSAGGSRFITCTAGTWSAVNLKCERRNCGSPGEVTNGYFTHEDTLFGDQAVAVCNAGHTLVGQNVRTCTDQGWSGRVPTCQVMTCDPPPQVENAVPFSPQQDSYNYREIVQYRCQKDYTLNGSSVLTCSEDGKFDSDPPKCIKVNCPSPNITDGHWVSGARPPYGFRAFVTYQCDSGFVMSGSSDLTCTINGKWSPDPPKCTVRGTAPSPTEPPSSKGLSVTAKGLIGGGVTCLAYGFTLIMVYYNGL